MVLNVKNLFINSRFIYSPIANRHFTISPLKQSLPEQLDHNQSLQQTDLQMSPDVEQGSLSCFATTIVGFEIWNNSETRATPILKT